MSSNPKLNHIHQDTSGTKQPEFSQNLGGTRVHYAPQHAPKFEDDMQDTLVLAPSNTTPIKAKRSFWFRMAQTLGILGSIAWGVTCFAYLLLEGGIATQTPYELGIFVAGTLAPVAFYWMLLSYMQRNSDVQYYAENLRAELHTLFFPSEEDSKRVNKDIERMTTQAAELAASSRAVLKSIQRTRQGLRQEIKQFAEFAGKAEGHLKSLSSNLEERTETAGKMVERAGEIEGLMEQGTDRFLNAAENAKAKSGEISEMFDGTITSLGLTVDAVVGRLGNMNEEFGSYTRSLQISTEELSKESGRMGVMIEDQIDQLQNATGQSVETITNALVDMSNHKDMLTEAATDMAQKMTVINDNTAQSVTALMQATDDIIARAHTMGETLSEKSQVIKSSLNGLDDQIEQIESVSDIASHRLSQGIDTATNGAIQIAETVRRGVDTLCHATKESLGEANTLVEDIIGHIAKLKQTEEGGTRSVETMVTLLEKTREQIERASITAENHVETLTNAVDGQSRRLEMSSITLADSVKNVSQSLQEPLRQVGIAIADADGRHEQIQTTLERRVTELKEVSQNATESASMIQQSLKSETNEMAKLSGHMITQSKTFNRELSESKTHLNDMIDQNVQGMDRLMRSITSHTEGLGQVSQSTVTAIQNVDDVMNVTVTKMTDAANTAKSALYQSQEAMIETADHLETTLIEKSSVIERAGQQLSVSCEQIIPLFENVEKGSERASIRMEETLQSYDAMASNAIDKFDLSSVEFDKRLVKLKAESDDVSNILTGTTEILREGLSAIELSAETAHNKIKNLTQAMDAQSSDIHILTDQATLKIENIQQLIQSQFRELSESVSTAVSDIEDAGLTFDGQAQKITDMAKQASENFMTAGNDAQAKAYELKQASQNVSSIAKDAVNDISQQMTLLETNSHKSLSNLQKTSDSLSFKSKEIDSMMQSVANQTKSYVDDMKSQIRGVAQESDVAQGKISQSSIKLMDARDMIKDKTKDLLVYVSETNQSIYDQSSRFVTAVAKSAQAAEQASDMFSKQTENLLKASHTAVQKAQDVEKTQLRVGRENFLSSARFVLESLHSLSIDFVRIMDGEIADKDWKSYQKGDIALFTSKLATRLDQIPADKIRDKYASDTEFRNYVQKFMRQFEDILNQTDTVDRGAVLGTTFAASDVGKIYRFLSATIGRELKTAA